MTDSRSTRVVFISDDPTRRERISAVMRDAGFDVAEASAAEEVTGFSRDASAALVLRDGRFPAFRVISLPGSACGETRAPGQIEIVLPDPAEPAALVDVACALLKLRSVGASFRVCGAESAPAAADPQQTGGSKLSAVKTLCHDLRTPLSAMAGRLHLMQNGKLGEAETKRTIEKLQNNVKDQVQLIDRVLLTVREEPE